MICEDCQFELGIEEYELHFRNSSRKHYRCQRCQEIVPMPNIAGNLIEDRILEIITEKEDMLKESLPISFLRFRKNCKHFNPYRKKSLYSGRKNERTGGKCTHTASKNMKRKRKRKYYPDLCNQKDCPLLK